MDPDGDARPHMGTVDMGADEFTGTHLLASDIFAFSAAGGGVVQLTLDAGVAQAGRPYILLGSITGTAPGTPLPGGQAILPLNWDLFTTTMIAFLNTTVFQGFLGTLDNAGMAGGTLDTLGPVPGAQGIVMSFAYALGNPWDLVSNPINVEILP